MLKTGWTTIVFCLFIAGCNSQSDQGPAPADPEQPRLVQETTSPGKSMSDNETKLDAELLNEISWHVRAGLYDKADLMRIICEEIYAYEDIDKGAVSREIDTQLAKWDKQKQTWPDVTDCDRLDSVFAALGKRGIIAMQNAGNTQSDGYEDFQYELEEHPDPASVIGYCFYHKQDLECVVGGDGLYLAFGPANPNDEETSGPEVGNIVREELEQAGFKVEWDGAFNKRIKVPEFHWQRR